MSRIIMRARNPRTGVEDYGFEVDAAEDIPEYHRTHMVEVLCWALDSPTGDLSECPAWKPTVAAAIGSLLTATGEECLGRGCRYAPWPLARSFWSSSGKWPK